MKVTSADGTRWKVRRQWMGKRPRLGKPDGWDGTGFDIGADDGIFAILGLIVAAAILLLLAWWVIAIAFEVTLIVVALLGGLFGRVVLRRPWRIVAANEHGGRRTWDVVGWRASRAKIREVGGALESGMPLPDQRP